MGELSIQQQQAIALASARKRQAESAAKPTLASEAVDYASQGLSGVNEGIANVVGFLPDMANNFLVAPALNGINAVAGTDFKASEKPFLGTEMVKEWMAPTIAPESTDPGKQIVRRIAQELPATLLPGAGAIAKSATPMKMLGAEVAAATGAGVGAATAEQLAPDNPLAQTAAALIGGFSPMVAASLIKRGAAKVAAPSVDALAATKNAAYDKADQLGVKYTPQAYGGLVGQVESAAKAKNISTTRHPKAASFIADMKARFANGASLTEMDQLRQEVRRDLIRSSDESEQFFGEVILDEIDDFIAKAGPNSISAGDPAAGNSAILAARSANTTLRKTETIEDAIYRANLNAASSGSGGNINNTLKQAFKGILLNPSKRRGFTAEEIGVMEEIVKTSKGEDAVRLLGKLAPSGNGLSAWLGILAASQGYGAVPAIGMVAKAIADRGTVGKAAKLRADVARGDQAAMPEFFSPGQSQVAQALLMGQAANQNAMPLTQKQLLVRQAMN